MVRLKVREYIQDILEDEVSEFLGRKKSEKIRLVDRARGYRNGYGKPKKFAMMGGTITVQCPRVRGSEERFERKVIPFFTRRSKEVEQLLPELYLHGLAKGDFDLALRGLLGEGAPLSASSIERLKAKWQLEARIGSSRICRRLRWPTSGQTGYTSRPALRKTRRRY